MDHDKIAEHSRVGSELSVNVAIEAARRDSVMDFEEWLHYFNDHEFIHGNEQSSSQRRRPNQGIQTV